MQIYQVDAFTDKVFGGNPAAVVPLEEWLADEIMQQIAAENNLAETAFYIPDGDDFKLRWFTPRTEVKLCGHATLATAHVLFSEKGYDKDKVVFHTKSGVLIVKKTVAGYEMDFPADTIKLVSNPPQTLLDGLGVDVLEVWKGATDYMVVVDNELVVQNLLPDFRLLGSYDCRGTIVTAVGNDVDFVSRCFYPQAGVDEDPTTGSAHTTLTPYWAKKLGKDTLSARQLSNRTGNLECVANGSRVLLRGNAVTYLVGEIKSII
ncbi:MAG: PhzF family phenazine biosynthesis protein [Saprospiraceae bacterium]|jgi:PhzF family phenazine biosynthesis protein